MPYNKFTKKEKGETKYCMESINSGKTYCYKSQMARAEGMRTHEMFKHLKVK